MRLKKFSLTALVSGLFISTLGFITPLIYWSSYSAHNGATGIIGGADAPTYTFMLSALFEGLPIVLILIGITLIVTSIFCLIFAKTVMAHCKISTSLVALGLSVVGALGLSCVSVWLVAVSFDGPSRYPIRYGLSILLGIACLFAFIILIGLYIKLRKANKSVKGFVLDVLTSIVYLPFFFVVFIWLYEIIS